MANIHYLNTAEFTPRGDKQGEEAASCEIILFPGVRYERWEEPPPHPRKAAHPKKARAKKCELEMAD